MWRIEADPYAQSVYIMDGDERVATIAREAADKADMIAKAWMIPDAAEALAEFVRWAEDCTKPGDPNSPHYMLAEARSILAKLRETTP